MVAEADESDRSFLKLLPSIAVMTNIDHEHLESYGGFDDLQQAFVDFANKVPFYGAVVACADDAHVARHVAAGDAPRRDLRPRPADARRRRAGRADRRWTAARATVVTAARRRASEALGTLGARRCPAATTCRTRWPRSRSGWSSACRSSAIAGGARGVSTAPSGASSAGEAAGILVVDDYGHHPTEIAAVLARRAPDAAGRRRRGVPAAPLHAHRGS